MNHTGQNLKSFVKSDLLKMMLLKQKSESDKVWNIRHAADVLYHRDRT